MSNRTPSNHFPTKLHELLDNVAKDGNHHIISWNKCGRSFHIHLPNEMVGILKLYFRQTKYKSFLRQLQGYGFKRVTQGANKGDVSHPMFVRGQRSLCQQMQRKSSAKKKEVETQEQEEKKEEQKVEAPLPKFTSSNSSFPMAASRGNARCKTVKPNMVGSSNTNADIQKLKISMQNAMQQPRKLGPLSKVLSLPCLGAGDSASNHFKNQQKRASAVTPTGMDALRVEIGCTFTTINDKKKNLKRQAPSSHPILVQSSASAPTLDGTRHSKRRRSYDSERLHHSLTSFKNNSNSSLAYKNASFDFIGVEEDAILTEEKLHFHKGQQAEKMKLSSIGTLDISMTTTTTTTTKPANGASPQVSSNSTTISNKFILPAQFEPTPMYSPKQHTAARSSVTKTCVGDGFTLDCSIDFSQPGAVKATKVDPSSSNTADEIVLLPMDMNGNKSNHSINTLEMDNSNSEMFTYASEVSDEIDEDIAEAFSQDGDNLWPSFDSDREDDDVEDEADNWAETLKGIHYEGEDKIDSSMEPIKVHASVSVPQHNVPQKILHLQHPPQQFQSLQHQQSPQKLLQQRQIPILPHTMHNLTPQKQHEIFLLQQQQLQLRHRSQQLQLQQQQALLMQQQQQQALMQRLPRPITVPQRRSAGLKAHKATALRSPHYALLTRPMPFNQRNCPSH